jgi:protein phosphatase
MTNTPHIRWSSAAATHVGLVRRINEDSLLDRAERGLWAVADGMGGHTMGDLASRMLVEALDALPLSGALVSCMETIDECLLNVNEALLAEAAQRHVPVIGTTAVVLTASGRQCAYLWAGDSRIYLYRDGQLRQLTRDHSQIEELLASGLISPEEAVTYPGRNFITRAVGGGETLDVDSGVVDIADGDIYLLCSDGLSNEVDEREMAKALALADCRHAADTLVDTALRHGGHDNVSVIVVRAEVMHS